MKVLSQKYQNQVFVGQLLTLGRKGYGTLICVIMWGVCKLYPGSLLYMYAWGVQLFVWIARLQGPYVFSGLCIPYCTYSFGTNFTFVMGKNPWFLLIFFNTTNIGLWSIICSECIHLAPGNLSIVGPWTRFFWINP